MRIKDWNKFQHFKDRRPPWIKLHRETLDQRDIMMISSCHFRLLVCLWMLASEDEEKEGRLPSIEDISFRIRMSEKEIAQLLLGLTKWVLNVDIKAISERYQVGLPETETETYKPEKEKEIEGGKSGKKPPKEIKKFIPPSVPEVETYMQEIDFKGDAQKFVDYYTSNGWKVGKNSMKDWKATVRTWRGNSNDKPKSGSSKPVGQRGFFEANGPGTNFLD